MPTAPDQAPIFVTDISHGDQAVQLELELRSPRHTYSIDGYLTGSHATPSPSPARPSRQLGSPDRRHTAGRRYVQMQTTAAFDWRPSLHGWQALNAEDAMQGLARVGGPRPRPLGRARSRSKPGRSHPLSSRDTSNLHAPTT